MVLPEIRFLQAAAVLAEELNFSRAAERLHIDQSTLIKRIHELEDQISLRLFVPASWIWLLSRQSPTLPGSA